MHDSALHTGGYVKSFPPEFGVRSLVTRQMIVEKAREYLDTPFHHQGRLKGVGVDCIGLLRCVADEIFPPNELSNHDCPNYARIPQGTKILDEMDKVLVRIPKSKAALGDVYIFWTDPSTKHPQHAALITDIGIIHTWERAGKVVETHLGEFWEERVLCTFTFPVKD